MSPLPLIVLTGFLGSGKTTTLRYWLEKTTRPLSSVAVIINDFGEINVDAALLAQRQMELRSITGGCACCQSFDELVQQVDALCRNPSIELVWIETSGLADPEEILDQLSAPELQGRASVRRVVLVLDGTDFPCSWRGRDVQAEQIRYADIILLNKTDLLTAERQAELLDDLRKINPNAEIISTQRGEIAPERVDGGLKEATAHEHKHKHAHANTSGLLHGAASVYVPLPDLIDQSVFQRFLLDLPESVYRAKGFVRFAESPKQLHTFQQVRDQAELLVLPLAAHESHPTGVVLIGPGLPEAEVREKAARFFALK